MSQHRDAHNVVCPRRRAAHRAAVAAFALGLAAGPLLAPLAAVAVPAETAQAELDAARAELAALSEELENAQALVETTELDLADTRQRIAQLETQVAETAAQLDVAQGDLSAQTVESYKGGAPSLVEIIFSSGSFEELTSRIYYANKVASATSERIDAVRALQGDLEAQRSELSARETELEGLLAQQTTSQDELEASLSQTRSYIDGLSAEVQQALEEERAAAIEDQLEQAEDAMNGEQPQGGDSGGEEPEAPATPDAPSTPETPSTPEEPAAPDEPAAPSGGLGGASLAQRQAIVNAAMSQVGVAYDYGACSPGVAFDCSGLTYYAYAQAGLSIPRGGGGQYRACRAAGNLKTNEADLVAGDIIYYQTGGNIRHVGVYIGGGMVCHASDYSTGVIVTSLHYSSGFCGGGSPV